MPVRIIPMRLSELLQNLIRRRSGLPLALFIAATIAATVLASVTQARAASETVLYNFSGFGPDYSGVIARPNGVLFGVTNEGGKQDPGGEVYRLAPPTTAGGDWKVAAPYKFGELGGPGPIEQLLRGADGALYGTTIEGGAYGHGSVFRLVATPGQGWVLTFIYSFQDNGDGAEPWGGVVAGEGGVVAGENGSLFGTTKFGGTGGGGVVYQLTPPAGGQGTWTEAVLHQFSGQDGTWPNAGLLVDNYGVLYGTTVDGGVWGQGTVFTLTPHFGHLLNYWTYQHLHDFMGTIDGANDGAQPNGGLIGEAGDLWGTTQGGGTGTSCSNGSNCGTAYELAQQTAGSSYYTMIIQHDFGSSTSDGAMPVAGLFQAKNGVYWGTASEGGIYTESGIQPCQQGCGTVFTFTRDFLRVGVWHYNTALSFLGAPGDGLYPASPLVSDKSGAIYGTTFAGGTGASGVVFQIAP